MTAPELKAIRLRLGLSCRQLALALGIEGIWRDRTIRRWESGKHPVPAWVEEKLRTIRQREYTPEGFRRAQD